MFLERLDAVKPGDLYERIQTSGVALLDRPTDAALGIRR
ncbi:hypothetical protein JOH50_007151 [Rhizobium leguminosarum]|nr:hypothetical protein [Rhizobium leguminosarum]